MCGITGYINLRKPIEKETLIRATKTLHHRGPEELSSWQSSDLHVGLGHTRLAIIDVAGGHQPMISSDESIRAVVNGEFYEYEKIRNELIAKGYSFRTHSDSEILIALYQEYGTECMSFLRGEFAFILWDGRKKQIFAGRDRFGIKPLFYSKYQGGLYLASEIKALLEFGIPSRWNEEGLTRMCDFIYPQSLTIFKDVYALKPGYILIATADDLKLEKYWDLNLAKAEDLPKEYDEAQYIKTFREKLEDAVRVRLRADVPVGCYLSGGIDSCSVLALASKIHHKPVKAFTIAFGDELFDESKIAKEMIKMTGGEHHEVKITQKDFADNFSDALWHAEQVIFNSHAVAKFILSKLVYDNHYKVVLTGEGSDELLGGYQTLKEDHINFGMKAISEEDKEKFLKIARKSPIASGILTTTQEGNASPEIEKIFGYLPTQLKVASVRDAEFFKLYNDEFQEFVINNNPILAFLKALDRSQLDGRNVLSKSMYLWTKTNMTGYILTVLGDRMEMAHSVEARCPFLDHPLYEFARGLPIEMKIRGTNEKYILKEAMKDLLPKSVYERTKQPFMAPPATDLKDSYMYKLMQETFSGEALNQLPFFDKTRVQTLLNKLPTMEIQDMLAAEGILLSVLSLCILKDRFKIT